MNYKIDRENNLYVIEIGKVLNDKIFKKVVEDILYTKGIDNKIYSYYTYFNQDCSYCIIDFNKRNLSSEDIENIINKNTKKR